MTRKKSHPTASVTKTIGTPDNLAAEIRGMILEARSTAAIAANASLTLLYWRIGRRVHAKVLNGERAEYGQGIVAALSRQLAADHGQSFSVKSLQRMIQFAEVFADEQIVVSLIRQLSWTHFIALIPLKEPLKRDFYAQMCGTEHTQGIGHAH